jgi:hypothetical protein
VGNITIESNNDFTLAFNSNVNTPSENISGYSGDTPTVRSLVRLMSLLIQQIVDPNTYRGTTTGYQGGLFAIGNQGKTEMLAELIPSNEQSIIQNIQINLIKSEVITPEIFVYLMYIQITMAHLIHSRYVNNINNNDLFNAIFNIIIPQSIVVEENVKKQIGKQILKSVFEADVYYDYNITGSIHIETSGGELCFTGGTIVFDNSGTTPFWALEGVSTITLSNEDISLNFISDTSYYLVGYPGSEPALNTNTSFRGNGGFDALTDTINLDSGYLKYQLFDSSAVNDLSYQGIDISNFTFAPRNLLQYIQQGAYEVFENTKQTFLSLGGDSQPFGANGDIVVSALPSAYSITQGTVAITNLYILKAILEAIIQAKLNYGYTDNHPNNMSVVNVANQYIQIVLTKLLNAVTLLETDATDGEKAEAFGKALAQEIGMIVELFEEIIDDMDDFGLEKAYIVFNELLNQFKENSDNNVRLIQLEFFVAKVLTKKSDSWQSFANR